MVSLPFAEVWWASSLSVSSKRALGDGSSVELQGLRVTEFTEGSQKSLLSHTVAVGNILP